MTSLFRYEKHMRQPVVDWLRGDGFVVRLERMLPTGYVDVLAFDSRQMFWAIELKLSNVSEAIRQCSGYSRAVHLSSVALPLPVAERAAKNWESRIERAYKTKIYFSEEYLNIGLIGVTPDDCFELVEAKWSGNPRQWIKYDSPKVKRWIREDRKERKQ